MLGRLARWLRAMGYDTLYPGQAEDRLLLRLARIEDRVLVTRDRMLARLAEARGCLIRAQAVDDQVIEAVSRLGLVPGTERWLSRCLDCNAVLEPRSPSELGGLVPERVLVSRPGFMSCPGCAKVYWDGSHADRMLERLERLLGRTRPRH